jgi:hypothetical protein
MVDGLFSTSFFLWNLGLYGISAPSSIYFTISESYFELLLKGNNNQIRNSLKSQSTRSVFFEFSERINGIGE